MGTVKVDGWRQEEVRPPAGPWMTFDEASRERSMSFVNALQELRNLKPQLYSAADYCEKSYLHNEQKQMVLDNLKDYTVRALVNAVDHLGNVAYKLTDLFDQQSSDVSNVGLRISCLDQQMLAFQHYIDREGIGQQQLLGTNRRHHKHYILPNSGVNKMRMTPQSIQNNAKTLSWHISSESGFMPKKTSSAESYFEGLNELYKATPEDFHQLDAVERSSAPLSLSAQLQTRDETPRPPIIPQLADFWDVPKSLPTAIKSMESPAVGREIIRPVATRNSSTKGVFSVLFAKSKFSKQRRRAYV